MNAVYPKSKLITREAKRLYKQEKEKAVDWFSEINESFILNLFADNSETYIGLYNSHLELWIKTHEWVRSTANFKYARVSKDWFSKTYRPLEIPKWQD